MLVMLLAGCTISSGLQERNSQAPGGGGNLKVSFVSSDSLGSADERTIAVAESRTLLDVVLLAKVERGQLRVEILQADGTVAFAIEGSPDVEQVGTGQVSTDDQGRLHYRVTTTEAHNGNYTIVYQPVK